ncbi:MAG: hypothetical protein OXN85_06945 [Gemmatimonadetes bacterium]|nr:hypothetical protein [Candidatus Palauibacter australiensis]
MSGDVKFDMIYSLFLAFVGLWAMYRLGIWLYERNRDNDYAGFTEKQKAWPIEYEREKAEKKSKDLDS